MTVRLLDESAEGVFIISATPFSENGTLDLQSADRLVEFYIEKGVSGVTILGMMGEAQKLTSDESAAFLKRVLKRVDNRVQVIVGVSSAGLDNLASLAKQSMDAGAAGVMVAPVSGLGTEEKLYGYFRQVFAALGTEIPVCYQDYPFVTGSEISVPAFNRLVADYPQLVMLKHEEWPGLNKLSLVRKAVDNGVRRVSVLVGNGGLYLPQELARGADGAMTGFAYPEMLVEVVRLHKAGEQDRAEDLFDAYLPLVRHEQQPGFGLALRKETLFRRGVIACPKVRAPGATLNSTDHDELSRLIRRVEKNVRALAS
ncbi:MAG: dihydrodipicolinate synthase family protein [Gammaproteobacteria bacterium]|nr:dihydrodipicolinate synthase family protein [Gammaproteobacteria bacterium]MDH4315935.1 dihydrodipicolinate synthase family protein [Gammaproteobacteria bacterium]MDH5215240.1 dihydrodipicolinate synthase family protein [Gammaproteobacteria bacterium]MDH5500947.1 dihydrodipicolinate synthase family protein [Gammaproteobacteria bacterium]